MPLFKIAIYQMSPSHHYPKIPNQRGIIFSQLKPAWVKDSVSAFQAFVVKDFFLVGTTVVGDQFSIG